MKDTDLLTGPPVAFREQGSYCMTVVTPASPSLPRYYPVYPGFSFPGNNQMGLTHLGKKG